uniref:Max-binding protein MNT n=1 Tax=Maylandia zebra TaxID=106582 RepID=A0A3P9DH17_9CICH
MSIDTLLEAARYLEWQAQQQQQTTREEEQLEDKELIRREAESKHVELVASPSQPVGANHVTWGDETHRQQPHHLPVPPPPSLPTRQLPIAVIPMVPVVTATTSVPPLPLKTPIAAAAATLNSSPPVKNSSSPPPQPATRQLLCSPQIKVEPSEQLIDVKPGASQLQVQIKYPAPISTNGSQHALVPHQAPLTPQPQPNGMTMEEMKGMEGKRRPGGAGTREVHNKLEKNRRAHLKECFETLKKNVPNIDEKKTSNLSVLRSALRYIQTLKRKEKEYEHEMERLAREKIATQQRLAELKNELSQNMDAIEIDRVLRQTIQPEDDQASTSTASEGEDNYEQDMDEDVPAPPAPTPLPKPAPPILQAQPLITPHLAIQHTTLPILTSASPVGPPPPQAIAPAPAPGQPPPPPPHPIQPPAMQVQPTVIAHATVSHASVIQAPITAQPIGHITVHPVAHLGSPLGMSVSQPTMVGHIAHTFTHHTLPHVQVNSATVVSQGSPSLGKPTAVLAPHPQLVGQATVLNPVTMVTVPTFPVSTLKLA